MKNLVAQVSEEKASLYPLLEKAQETDRVFHEAWERGTKEMGWKAYKETDEYMRTLNPAREANDGAERLMEEKLEGFRQGDESHFPALLAFLGWKGRFHRSGYIKGKIARTVKKHLLSVEVADICCGIFLTSIKSGGGEFKEIEKWAPHLPSGKIKPQLEDLLDSDEEHIKKRAERVLDKHFSS